MGALNCQTCDCNLILSDQEMAVAPQPPQITATATQPLIDASLKPKILRLEALWEGYSERKLLKAIRRRLVENYTYFTKAEILETLGTSPENSFQYKNSAVYTGDWLGGFRHGYGMIQYPDGARYEGMWSYGRPFGAGKFIHPDLEVFNGSWKHPCFDKSDKSVDDGYSIL